MTDKELEDRLEETWSMIIKDDQDGFVATSDLKQALDQIGYKLPNYQVREIIKDLEAKNKLDNSKGISKAVFKEICNDQRRNETAQKFKTSTQVTDEKAITETTN